MKKTAVIAGCLFGLFFLAAAVYAYNLYHSVQNAAVKMYQPVEGGKVEKEKKKAREDGPNPISILLMGVDERKNDVGRSDTLIVMTLNPDTDEMSMISIPRDTRVQIPGRGWDKINAAYAYGGTSLALETVKDYLDIPIDYYIRINMEGLSDLVDAVGGVDVHNDISWHDEGYYKKGYFYQKGDIHLNGPQALGYVRMRHLDPRGDFGRNERQRDVIRAIINQSADVSSFAHYQTILDAISNNVITDMTFKDMKYVAMNYRECRNDINSYEVHGIPQRIDGLSFVVVSESEREKVHDMIMNQLKASQDGETENAAEANKTARQ
ncbi:MAG TPA: LCP family protein [Bacillales bacterium]|nr:LCP family protein [Bacillales bacterium]